MDRFVVRSYPAPGFDGVFRAELHWPADGVAVVVSDKPVSAEQAKGARVISPELFDAIKADRRLQVTLPQETLEAVSGMRARIAELEAENAALKAQVAAMTKAPDEPPAPPEAPADAKAKTPRGK